MKIEYVDDVDAFDSTSTSEYNELVRKLWEPGEREEENEAPGPPTEEQIERLVEDFKVELIPELKTSEFVTKIHSRVPETVKDVCIHLMQCLAAGRELSPAVFDVEVAKRECQAAFFLCRTEKRFKEVLCDPNVMQSSEFDILDCIWGTYAHLCLCVHLASTIVPLPAARGLSYVAGEIFRLSCDERVFARMYKPKTDRPNLDYVLMLSRVSFAATNRDEKDKTIYYHEENAETKGVVKRVEPFTELHKVDYLRFGKLASRFELACLRAKTFLDAKLVYRVNAYELFKRMRSIYQLLNDESVRLTAEQCSTPVDTLATALAVPLMGMDDANLRMQAEVSAATILGQSVGISRANSVRSERTRPGIAVLKEPSSRYHDAWVVVLFDRLIAADTDFHPMESAMMLDHQWPVGKNYLKHQEIDEKKQVLMPYMIRVLHKWYVSVAVPRQSKLPVDVLIPLKRVPDDLKSAVLIECENINECVCLWYWIVKVSFGGKVSTGASIKNTFPMFVVGGK